MKKCLQHLTALAHEKMLTTLNCFSALLGAKRMVGNLNAYYAKNLKLYQMDRNTKTPVNST